jgi:hypothetical protein
VVKNEIDRHRSTKYKNTNTCRTEYQTYLSRMVATNCGTSFTVVVAWILPQDTG